jgi:hypothetical protein
MFLFLKKQFVIFFCGNCLYCNNLDAPYQQYLYKKTKKKGLQQFTLYIYVFVFFLKRAGWGLHYQFFLLVSSTDNTKLQRLYWRIFFWHTSWICKEFCVIEFQNLNVKTALTVLLGNRKKESESNGFLYVFLGFYLKLLFLLLL